ncbi:MULTISPECIES: glycosyltransferase family 2 protein [unclassified Rhizobium]|uniref:glycosyltransferase family 2 protein n=1 Tax=unclassified Rhizobium TaxID=2613769 RepID=UPI0013C4C657|nr:MULTISPECIES: glycosyltransferase family 2 protein [unclassified Rhizobium]
MQEFDITVIVPTFRAEKTIRHCLESVLSQPGVSTEIIVIDGGSSDGTASIAQSFSSPNMIIVSEPDRGIYDAINKGVSRAKGGLIGVLGADDAYKPNILSAVKENASGGREIVAGLTLIDGQLRADEGYGSAALISGIPFGHNAMFASREAYQAVGLYDLTYRICADAEWVHRAIKLDISCHKVEQVFVEFGTEGTSSTNPEEIIVEACSVIQRNFPFLSQGEAKYLLYGVRGWGETGAVEKLRQKYGHESALFVSALREAFPAMETAAISGRGQRYLGRLRNIISRVF